MNGSYRILVAAQPSAWRVLQAMLGDVADLVAVHSTADAFKILERERIDLILCTIAFDESQMMDFLQAAKRTPSTAGIPLLCSRVERGVLRENLVATMRAACMEAGAVDLLDLATLSPDDAQAVLRQAVGRNFASPKAPRR
jgi:CheY-like chemotaxis protein